MGYKYEALARFIADRYEPLNNWIYFNALLSEDGNSSINTIQSTNPSVQYIDGSTENELLFSVAMVKTYDVEMSETNLEAIMEVDNFVSWIQNLTEYPVIGDDCIVNDIIVIDDVPSLSVDESRNLAKYQFNCRLEYIKLKQEVVQHEHEEVETK